MEAAGVVPVDPAQGGQFDVLDGLPRPAAGWSVDQLSLVVAIDRLGKRVDAPIFVKGRFGLVWVGCVGVA